MRELVLKMSVSLDGFVAGTRADSNWPLRAGTPDSAAWVFETLSGAGAHLIGHRLFEGFARLWPTSTNPMAAPMNDIPKVVFTRQATFDPTSFSAGADESPAAASWSGARVASGDLAEEINRLKHEPGGYLLAQGGVDFGRSLVHSGLIDEYRFVVLPVALGSGSGLFTELSDELDLQLISSTAFDGGAIANVYRPKS
ncbi:dihydrofolate reductase family protein [Subtercola endophyticus]|uniref:dihydrofolate reductase family protein n=1 Tax=Subtercola endophyticus TaxID=2895559 RepID=UPI001E3E526B|nr:dihydrofolate reductase family protein [Subtercola endophyticus]UFS59122.1 dihydrofolate reductase family protein [Subtercola endophyticus]